MALVDGLALDHLYVSIPTHDFEDLASLLRGYQGIPRKTVQSGADSWEGIYAFSRSRSYFEFLNGRRKGGLGIAISPYNPMFLDARKIQDEFPDLAWKTGTRTFEDGRSWFDWITLGDYLTPGAVSFNAWIMHYHPNHLLPKQRPIRPAVDSWAELHVTAGFDVKEEIERYGSWIPGERCQSANELVYSLPDRDGGRVHLRMSFQKACEKFLLKSLTWWPTRESVWEARQVGPWTLEPTGNKVRLIYAGGNDRVSSGHS